MYSFRAVVSVLIAVCATAIGCGGSDLPPTYPVTGKVTLQGSPLNDYVVSFFSEKGDITASGNLGSDGAYSMTTVDGRPGCTAGKFKVVLRPKIELDAAQAAMKNMKPLSKGQSKEKTKLPDSFSGPGTSTKQVEVKAGPNVIDVAI